MIILPFRVQYTQSASQFASSIIYSQYDCYDCLQSHSVNGKWMWMVSSFLYTGALDCSSATIKSFYWVLCSKWILMVVYFVDAVLTVMNIYLAAMVGSSALTVHSPGTLLTLYSRQPGGELPAGLISPFCTMKENQPSAVSSNIDTPAWHKTWIRVQDVSFVFALWNSFDWTHWHGLLYFVCLIDDCLCNVSVYKFFFSAHV